MSAKQDRVAPRTAEDLERKYNYGQSFSEVMGIATDAQKAANQANETARQCHSEIIKLADSITLKVTGGEAGNTASIVLTVGDEEYKGQINLTGLVTFESLETEGQTEINGSNIKTGAISNPDGTVKINLSSGEITATGKSQKQLPQEVRLKSGRFAIAIKETDGFWHEYFNIDVNDLDATDTVFISSGMFGAHNGRISITGNPLSLGSSNEPVEILGKTVSWKGNGDGTYTLIGI